jgi:hypothetical protein
VKPYNVLDVPETGDGKTGRYELPVSPGGWTTTKAANVGACYSQLIDRLAAAAPRLAPKPRTVRLLRARPADDDGYELVDRGTVTAAPTLEPRTPSKFARISKTGGALLDDLLLGTGEGWDKAPDDALFAALRDVCEHTHASGQEARYLSDIVALAILIRHGIHHNLNQLPG